MPQPLAASQFEKDNPSELANEGAPIFSTAMRTSSSLPRGHDSFALGRVSTSQSTTHDMSTGTAREGAGRGYGFDEAPAAPTSIARYTSRESQRSFAELVKLTFFARPQARAITPRFALVLARAVSDSQGWNLTLSRVRRIALAQDRRVSTLRDYSALTESRSFESRRRCRRRTVRLVHRSRRHG